MRYRFHSIGLCAAFLFCMGNAAAGDPQADVSVTKTTPARAVAGSDVAYTLTVANAGPDQSQSVTLSDALPPDLAFVSLTQHDGPLFGCTLPAVGNTGTVTCNAAQLDAGQSAQFTLVARLRETLPGGSLVQNTATVDTSSFDGAPANDASSAPLFIINKADVSVTKTAAASVVAGENLVYTIVMTNNGPDFAPDLFLVDALQSNTTFVSLSIAGFPAVCNTPPVGSTGQITCLRSLASGTSLTLTVTVQVSADSPNGSLISNVATAINTSSADPNPANNVAESGTTVISAVDLSLSKTAPTVAAVGSNLPYTITLANAGPSSAGNVFVTDPLPANTTFVSLAQAGTPLSCITPAAGSPGTVTCMSATYANGASTTLTLTVRVSDTAADDTPIVNDAAVTTASTDEALADNTASATTTVDNPLDLVLTKTGPGNVEPGATFAYMLDLASPSNAVALDVVLVDALPAQTRFVSLVQNTGPAFICTTPAVGANGTVSCSIAALPSGAVVRFTLTVSLAPGATGTVTNTASVSTSSADAAPANNASSSGAGIGFGPATAPITIPTLSWFGLLALVLAVGLFGAALVARQR